MIISPPLYPQSAAVNIPYSQYGDTASNYFTSQPFSSGPDTSSDTVLEQISSFVSQMAQSVYSSVMEYLAPIFGYGGTQSSGSSLLDSFIPYASKSTTKQKTFLDKLIAWFKSIGDFGTNVSKGMKSGRDILAGVTSAFTWLQENDLGDTVVGIGNDINNGLNKIGESITSAAKAFWEWLF